MYDYRKNMKPLPEKHDEPSDSEIQEIEDEYFELFNPDSYDSFSEMIRKNGQNSMMMNNELTVMRGWKLKADYQNESVYCENRC